MAVENIILALSVDNEQALQLVKQSTTRFGKMFLEVLTMADFTKDDIKDCVHIEGYEHLVEAVSYGKGAVLATSHSGNFGSY